MIATRASTRDRHGRPASERAARRRHGAYAVVPPASGVALVDALHTAPSSARGTAVVQRNGKDKVKQQYRYLSDEDQERYASLAGDVKQELFKKGDLSLSESAKFSPETERSIMEMLSSVEGLHFGSNPSLGTPWQNIVESYSGSKTGAALYSHVRSPGFTNVLKTFDVNWGSFAKPPEVHHLIYKKEEPKSAVAPWNLMLATRGSSRNKSVGQHEGMLHHVSSPPGRPNISQSVYVNEVPAVKGIIRRWAQGERPKVTMPNPIFKSAFDVYPQLGMGSNPTGTPTLSYQPPFQFPGPELWRAQQDNRIFAHPEEDYFSPFDDEHGHWSGFDESELMKPPVQEWSPFSSQPSFGFDQPSFGFDQPSFGFDQPSFGFDQPSFGFDQPSFGFQQPSFGFGQSSFGYQQPSLGFNQPSFEHEQPSFGLGLEEPPPLFDLDDISFDNEPYYDLGSSGFHEDEWGMGNM